MLDKTAVDTFVDQLNAATQSVQRLPRVRFEIGLGDAADTWIRRKHDAGAVHEPATLGAMLAAVDRFPVRRFFDVGALFGYFSIFSLQTFPGVDVTAFEMHPGCIEALRVNVGPHAKCVHASVSDRLAQEETIWISGFNIYEEPEGGWETLPSVPGAMKERGANNRGRGFIKTDFITLDDHCAWSGPPDLIKIDVEAYQAKAIRGGLETFRKYKPVIIIELHDLEKVQRMGTTNKDTVQPLFDLGYCGYWSGNFRARDARFERVEAMGDEHERLSLMVFVP